MSCEQLLDRIEKIRLDLYDMSRDKKLTDPEVVRMSQLLDKLLNWYWERYLQFERKTEQDFLDASPR